MTRHRTLRLALLMLRQLALTALTLAGIVGLSVWGSHTTTDSAAFGVIIGLFAVLIVLFATGMTQTLPDDQATLTPRSPQDQDPALAPEPPDPSRRRYR